MWRFHGKQDLMGCCDDDDDYGCKVVFLTSEFSGRLGTGFLLWGQERGRSCMWKTLRWRVGIMKGNAEGCSICSNAAMLRTMLCGFVCNRVLHLVPPWPCRSLLCSCWVRLAIVKSYCPSFSFLLFCFFGFHDCMFWLFSWMNLVQMLYSFIYWLYQGFPSYNLTFNN